MEPTVPKDSVSSQTNGWSAEAEQDIRDMRERVEGWYWLHTESMILYSRYSICLVVFPAALNFVSSFFNIRESETVPQVYVGLLELIAGLIVVIASQLKYGEVHKSHKEASQKLANLRWQLDAELNKRHWEDRIPFQDFFASISGDYADATFSTVESIPSRYKKRYLRDAPVDVYPEIILTGRRDKNECDRSSDGSVDNRDRGIPFPRRSSSFAIPSADALKFKEIRTGVLEGVPSFLRRQAALQKLASNDAKLRTSFGSPRTVTMPSHNIQSKPWHHPSPTRRMLTPPPSPSLTISRPPSPVSSRASSLPVEADPEIGGILNLKK